MALPKPEKGFGQAFRTQSFAKKQKDFKQSINP